MVVLGVNVHIFHWHVLPMPTSWSDTEGLFTLSDTHEPIAPDTVTKEICTSHHTNIVKANDYMWTYVCLLHAITTEPIWNGNILYPGLTGMLLFILEKRNGFIIFIRAIYYFQSECEYWLVYLET